MYDLVAAAQVALNVITLAFLVVAGTCAVLIPVMLYVFWLKPQGWQWYDAALFGSMIASTDAVAIVAVLKKSAPLCPSVPECLRNVHTALPGDVLQPLHRFNSSFQLEASIQAQLDATGRPVKVKMFHFLHVERPRRGGASCSQLPGACVRAADDTAVMLLP